MRQKLTELGLRAIQPKGVVYSIGDAACPGLLVRITASGTKTFAFAYRQGGKVKWLTIGRYPDVSLAKARELATDARKSIAAGGATTPKAQAVEVEKKHDLR
jgi:hypothetical protein